MVSSVRAAVFLSCITALLFLGITPSRAAQNVEGVEGIPTGQIVPLVYGQGSYIDANGKTQEIFNVWLRDMEGTSKSIIFTLKPGGEPKVGSKYQMSTPEAVRTTTLWPAYWLVQHHADVGRQLEYWSEQEAMQLAIWGYDDEAFLSPEHVPDSTVLVRAQELCNAAKEAIAKSQPRYMLVHRHIGLSVYVRSSMATKTVIGARLFDVDNNKGLESQPLDLSYDELQTTVRTNHGGVVIKEYPRRDATVEVDVHYQGRYAAGIPWDSTNGEGFPVVTGDILPVSFNTGIRVDPSSLTTGSALVYQVVGNWVSEYTPLKSAPAAVIALIVLIGSWVLLFSRWLVQLFARKNKKHEA